MSILKGLPFPLKLNKKNLFEKVTGINAKAAEVSAVLYTKTGERVHRIGFGNRFDKALFKSVGKKRDDFLIREINRALLTNVDDIKILGIDLENKGKSTDIIVVWGYNGIEVANKTTI